MHLSRSPDNQKESLQQLNRPAQIIAAVGLAVVLLNYHNNKSETECKNPKNTIPCVDFK